MLLLAYIAALAGYGAWQFGRYRSAVPRREAPRRAIADVAAFAIILLPVWIGGTLLPRWSDARVDGAAGATAGVVLGVVLAGPVRRAVLKRLGIDPAGVM